MADSARATPNHTALDRFTNAMLVPPGAHGEPHSPDYTTDNHVAQSIAATLACAVDAAADLTPTGRNLIVVGSPRFNALADQLQQALALPCQYAPALATGDAAARDASDALSRSLRVLRLVSSEGEELSASVDASGDRGVDYGMIVYARLEAGCRLLWISGIRAQGVLGAWRHVVETPSLVEHMDAAMANAVSTGQPASEAMAATQVVRVGASGATSALGAFHLSGSRVLHTSPRGLLVDLGDVVMKFDRDRGYRAIAHLLERDYREVRAAVHGSPRALALVARYETGQLGTAAFCDALRVHLGGSTGLTEHLPQCWADIFWPNAEMIELLGALKRSGLVLGLVSNTNAVHIDWLTRHYPDVLALFDERSLSFEVGAAKPAPAIFEDALGRMQRRGLARESLLYVDDLAPYVHAMQSLGVAGFTYRSHPHFVLWLRQHGVPVPTILTAPPPAT